MQRETSSAAPPGRSTRYQFNGPSKKSHFRRENSPRVERERRALSGEGQRARESAGGGESNNPRGGQRFGVVRAISARPVKPRLQRRVRPITTRCARENDEG